MRALSSSLALILGGCSIIAPFDYDEVGLSPDADADSALDSDVDRDADEDRAPLHVVVEPVYLTHPNWNDYVANDRGDTYAATGEDCTYSFPARIGDCIHAGELRKIVISGRSSCLGLVLEEQIGAFEWTCRENDEDDSVTFYTAGLAPDKGLRDLIEAGAFRLNSVVISDSDGPIARSTEATWGWGNIIEPLPEDEGSRILAPPDGAIYYLDHDLESPGYNLNADHIAIVVMGDHVLILDDSTANCNVITGEADPPSSKCLIAAGSQDFLWFEGRFRSTGSDAFAIVLADVSFSRIHRTGVEEFLRDGIRLARVSATRLESVTVVRARYGIQIENSSFNVFSRISVARNAGYGIDLDRSNGNRLWLVRAVNNLGGGVSLRASSGNAVVELTSANSGTNDYYVQHGVHLDRNCSDNTIVGSLSFSNVESGFMIDGAARNTILHTTSANNGGHGLAVTIGGDLLTAHSFAAFNCGVSGVYHTGSDAVFSDIACGDNNSYGVQIASGSSNNVFTGELLVWNGGRIEGLCGVEGDGSGLIDGTCADSAGDGTQSYTGHDSDAELWVREDLSVALVGKVASDSVNGNEIDGVAPYSLISDWLGFENRFRGWGRDGSDYPNDDHRSRCVSGEQCRIWDWSLSDDSVLHGRNGVWSSDVCTVEFGDVMQDNVQLEHYDGINAVNDLGEPCEMSDTCRNRFLGNAIERMDDGHGDDDGLCERDERCLFAPHVGAYQGEGELDEVVCAATDGVITGVELTAYSTQ